MTENKRANPRRKRADKRLIHEPERMGPLSMEGLSLEEALRGAMQVQPPEKPLKRPRKPKPPQKG